MRGQATGRRQQRRRPRRGKKKSCERRRRTRGGSQPRERVARQGQHTARRPSALAGEYIGRAARYCRTGTQRRAAGGVGSVCGAGDTLRERAAGETRKANARQTQRKKSRARSAAAPALPSPPAASARPRTRTRALTSGTTNSIAPGAGGEGRRGRPARAVCRRAAAARARAHDTTPVQCCEPPKNNKPYPKFQPQPSICFDWRIAASHEIASAGSRRVLIDVATCTGGIRIPAARGVRNQPVQSAGRIARVRARSEAPAAAPPREVKTHPNRPKYGPFY